MNWQNLSTEETLKKLKVDINHGLNNIQVSNRREKFGKNIIQDGVKFNFLQKFINQFSDFMVITLLIASIISFITSVINKNNDYIDSIIILFIVICNAIIGVAQESKAHKAIDSLKKLSASKIKVRRNSRDIKILSDEIVPGDILLLESGDKICADARVLTSRNLKVEESILTGESDSVSKKENKIEEKTPVLEASNMIFSGSFVTSGRSISVAVETGMNTQIGKIAGLINNSKTPQTPLQKKLAETGKILSIGTIVISLIVFILGIINKTSILEMFMLAISLAVAAIPEGLPAIITIALANGVKKMAKHNVIIRKLPAVETLGSATVICTDKTGTLTQNKMTVTEIYNFKNKLNLESDEAFKIINLANLCSNAKNLGNKFSGDPTECAMLFFEHKNKNFKNSEDLKNKFKRIKEIPFNSEKKMMTTINYNQAQDEYLVVCKGAPEIILNLCDNYFYNKNNNNNNIQKLDEKLKQEIIKNYEFMASRALRVLAVAYKKQENYPQNNKNLIFLGLIGIIDPPRKEAKLSVQNCIKAGIKPVMITGDHVLTAKAIGKELGIFTNNSREITGKELDKLSQTELEKNIYLYSIFARVSPEHKVRIIRAFQARGEIVAMTGDGVNDAPALKTSNIGCAMGKSGTDVAKSASDMILTDDNFSSIVEAAKQGRGIYKNIQKTIHFLISTNIGEIIAVLIAFLMNLPTPLLAIQLLWINLVTDSFPALALVIDPFDSEIIKNKPENLNKLKNGFMSGKRGYNMLIEGIFIGIICIIAFLLGRNLFDLDYNNPIIGRTMAFMTIGISQLAHAFNVRSEESIFKSGILGNAKLILATIMCTFLQVIVVFIEKLNILFRTDKLNLIQWLIVLSLSVLPTIVSEIEKKISKNKSQFLKAKNLNKIFSKLRN